MPTTVIGGNKLSAFYSTALFVPWSGATTFTPFASQGGGFQYPFLQATTRIKFGVADTTDSFSPFCRNRFETEGDWDALLNVFYNPDNPPRGRFTPTSNYIRHQLYLTLSNASMYPAGETPQYYWIPSVVVREIPHKQQLNPPPALPIEFNLLVEAAAPCFLLPNDLDSGLIAQFITYCASITPNPWGW